MFSWESLGVLWKQHQLVHGFGAHFGNNSIITMIVNFRKSFFLESCCGYREIPLGIGL